MNELHLFRNSSAMFIHICATILPAELITQNMHITFMFCWRGNTRCGNTGGSVSGVCLDLSPVVWT